MESSYQHYYEKYVTNANNLDQVRQLEMHHVMRLIFQEHPEINSIVVRGWTPVFNDGDPCYHHQQQAVGPVYHEDFIGYEDWLPTADLRADITEFTVDPPLADADIPKQLNDAYTLVENMEPEMQAAFGTDVICVWLRNPKNSSDIQFFTNPFDIGF